MSGAKKVATVAALLCAAAGCVRSTPPLERASPTVEVFCKDQPATELGAVLSSDRSDDPVLTQVTWTDDDLSRVMTACAGDLERVKQVLLFTIASRGTPSRTWGAEAEAGGLPFKSASPLRPFLTRVLEIRRTHPSLVTGIPWMLEVGADRFVQARLTDGEAAILAVNRRHDPLTLEVPEELAHGDWHEVLTGQAVQSRFTVPARSVALFVGRGKSLTQYRKLRERAEALWKGRAGRGRQPGPVRAIR